MPGQGHDALDLRVPVDVVSPAATRQEPSVLFESAPDSSSGGVHACRYLHDRPAESQPARPPRQDAADQPHRVHVRQQRSGAALFARLRVEDAGLAERRGKGQHSGRELVRQVAGRCVVRVRSSVVMLTWRCCLMGNRG